MLVSSAVCTDGKEVKPKSRWPPLPIINMQFERFHMTQASAGLRSINVWSSYSYNWNCYGGFPCSLIVERCSPAAQSVGFYLDLWYFFLVLLNNLCHCSVIHCQIDRTAALLCLCEKLWTGCGPPWEDGFSFNLVLIQGAHLPGENCVQVSLWRHQVHWSW